MSIWGTERNNRLTCSSISRRKASWTSRPACTSMAIQVENSMDGYHGNFVHQIRVIRPIKTDDTEVFLYPTFLKGAPHELNVARLRGHEAFYGPAGGGATDDLEMFERNQIGLSARVDPWLILSRGRRQEYEDVDRTIVGQITDEVTQRGIWRQWKKVMSQRVNEAPARLDGSSADPALQVSR